MTTYVCPVCGFADLEDAPYSEDGTPSYEFCDCCCFQFGYTDGSQRLSHEEWRRQWIDGGCKWRSAGIPMPENWNPVEQLKNLDR